MGKHARIAELERLLAEERLKGKIASNVMDFVRGLAQLPEDAVLLYTLTGQRMSHQIGLSARCLLQQQEKEPHGPNGTLS